MIRWVRQEDPCGCAIASLAMVTGRGYAEVRAWFEGCDFVTGGITHFDAEVYLGDHGIPFALRYRWLPGYMFPSGLTEKAQRRRSEWPARPFAPAHIIGINGGRHDVVLLPDGTVLDPMQEQPRHLSDVGDVSFMLGVWPDVRLESPAGV